MKSSCAGTGREGAGRLGGVPAGKGDEKKVRLGRARLAEQGALTGSGREKRDDQPRLDWIGGSYQHCLEEPKNEQTAKAKEIPELGWASFKFLGSSRNIHKWQLKPVEALCPRIQATTRSKSTFTACVLVYLCSFGRQSKMASC